MSDASRGFLPRRFFKLAGNVVIGLSLIFLARKVFTSVESFPRIQFSAMSMIAILAAIGFSPLLVWSSSVLWKLLLRADGASISWVEAFFIVGRANIAKYLPGKFMHVLGRSIHAGQRGISQETVLLSSMVETCLVTTAMAAVCVVGLVCGCWRDSRLDAVTDQSWTLPLFSILFCLALLTLTLKPARRVARKCLRYLRIENIAFGLVAFAGLMLIYGIVIKALLVHAWGCDAAISWLDLSFGFTLAALAGCLVLTAPAGIGVREAVFVALFEHQLGTDVCISLVVGLRAFSTLGDLVAFLLTYLAPQVSRSSRPALRSEYSESSARTGVKPQTLAERVL